MSSIQSSRYELLPGFLLGFHGTEDRTVEKVLSSGREHLKPSRNDYDWLGHGVYFWEYSPERAMDFALQAQDDKKITKGKIYSPAVVGAIIDPGVCLNLLEASALKQVKEAHDLLSAAYSPEMLPKNKGGNDLRARYLDCTVIQFLHSLRQQGGLPEYDTVRGAFWEGAELYPGAGFKEKNHVQICVRNPACIKGYFRVMEN